LTGNNKKGHDSVTLKIRVNPRASRTEFAGFYADSLRLRVKAPPVDGAANKECIRFLAKTFKVAKSGISIRSGHKSREKVFEIAGINIKDVYNITDLMKMKEK
jgi:uncharacterized protein